MNRSLTTFVCAAALGALLPSKSAFADDKCTIATKPESVVGKACAEGGRKAAKKLMKEIVKKAKEKGTKFQCDGCHKNMDGTMELNKEAKADFKKLLAAAGV
jgi:hypothetical protein